MAFDSSLCSSYSPSMNWDLHSFGVYNAEMSLAMTLPFSSDLSSGYLEDAIVDWSYRCKRLRTFSYSHDQNAEDTKNNQNLNAHGDPFMSFSNLRQNNDLVADLYHLNNTTQNIINGSVGTAKTKTGGSEQRESLCSSSSCSSQKDSVIKCSNEKDVTEGGCGTKKILYPFDVVKPGGIEGDVTLNDINKRMLMRPTKPVRHPVGEFASNPCVAENGFGRSGKAVVALTKIHTQGRGTITIIRTRG